MVFINKYRFLIIIILIFLDVYFIKLAYFLNFGYLGLFLFILIIELILLFYSTYRILIEKKIFKNLIKIALI